MMDHIRSEMRAKSYASDAEVSHHLAALAPSREARAKISQHASAMVERLRAEAKPSMMELFLAEYGLSSEEGVALMCLAEALLRVPDAATMDALIEDKIAPSEWGKHLGESRSTLVNASTWALLVTGQVLDAPDTGMAGLLRGAIKRLGEPIIRQAVARVMRQMGQQFVFGQTIQKALSRAASFEAKGYLYSYDMLGEAAITDADARGYHMAYADAIAQIAKAASSKDISSNPGISIKLSALHPNYDLLHRAEVMDVLVPRARSLALLAKSAGIGLNIDAEEAARLDLSLDVIEAVLSEPSLARWDGFGVVVQAYGKRAAYVIDWLYALAQKLDRRIMVRLVKGAYWDTEIKLAQVEGLPGFPVLATKPHTDMNYICCAQKLLAMSDRIYPQFATHNAHTIAAVVHSAAEQKAKHFEFQRLHGMGEALHDQVLRKHGVACRIYAPVGHHSDLLAYLVRRLLENGANSSFVNQIFDAKAPVHVVAADPFEKQHEPGPKISLPADIFASERPNSKGFDLSNPEVLAKLQAQRARRQAWSYGDLGEPHPVHSPTTGDQIGQIRFLSADQARQLAAAATPWQVTAAQRATVLRKAANLYESHAEEFFALLTHEAGKTLSDCISELREAVDFLRYYAHQAEALDCSSYGVFTCISPWNFPLAIFTGQIAAALAMGNGVLAKPAEATSLIAMQATALLHQAGIPKTCLQLLPGQGAIVGPVVCGAPNVTGVCFTGSTKTAQAINQVMADNLEPHAPLIAETGGLNAMIVDSTALLEQAVQDVVDSAFQSAGQRCSALRMLYVQSDIADAFERMLCGAMQALVVGSPEAADCDVGPVIDAAAQGRIAAHIANHKVLFQTSAPEKGYFITPTILSVSGMSDLHEEIFGPVLHLARYDASDLDRVIDDINASGYGLTFGFHSRIDDRVQKVVSRVNAGNLYINRNQIGAVVGSQPFGGHGLSGTGPKAGGPCYLPRFAPQKLSAAEGPVPPKMDLAELEQAFAAQAPKQSHTPKVLPGPTGESNRYLLRPRSRVLCMGLGAETRAQSARDMGCCAIAAEVTMSDVTKIPDLQAVVYAGPQAQALRQALSARHGAIVPLLMDEKFKKWLVCEQSICINTTAAGGNTALLAS